MNIYSDGEVKKMKVCVTATAGDLNAQVDPRFGRCQYFVFVDPDTMAIETMPNDAIAASGGSGMGGGQGGGIGRSKGLDKQQPTSSQAPLRIKKGVIL